MNFAPEMCFITKINHKNQNILVSKITSDLGTEHNDFKIWNVVIYYWMDLMYKSWNVVTYYWMDCMYKSWETTEHNFHLHNCEVIKVNKVTMATDTEDIEEAALHPSDPQV